MSTPARPKPELVMTLLLFAALLATWYLSEVNYARRIAPGEISTIPDYFARFGDPQAVRLVLSEGRTYYEFVGAVKPPLSFALPSSPPAYIFDQHGNFITWSSDPGDDPRHRQGWPLQDTNQIAVQTLKQEFLSTPTGRQTLP